ncbi:MAG: transglutaminase domain-containing protein [Planctomycetota bacterium]
MAFVEDAGEDLPDASLVAQIDGRDVASDRVFQGNAATDDAVMGVWTLPSTPITQMLSFVAEYEVTASRLQFDESRARRVEWAAGSWPAAAEAMLEPQEGIELSDGARVPDTALSALLSEATGGRDPKSIGPVQLAKWLAGQIATKLEVSGVGAVSNDRGQVVGAGFSSIGLKTYDQTLADGEGSSFDVCNVLVALYRKAGLPARLVIAYDAGAEEPGKRNRLFEGDERGAAALRPYVEFALYDERTDSLGWVPVDIVALSERLSTMPQGFLQRPQEGFGTNRELDAIIPLAFAYTPDGSTSSAKAPAFFGLVFQPGIDAPEAQRAVVIDTATVANRGRRRR